jgi:hypothetical protein
MSNFKVFNGVRVGLTCSWPCGMGGSPFQPVPADQHAVMTGHLSCWGRDSLKLTQWLFVAGPRQCPTPWDTRSVKPVPSPMG